MVVAEPVTKTANLTASIDEDEHGTVEERQPYLHLLRSIDKR